MKNSVIVLITSYIALTISIYALVISISTSSKKITSNNISKSTIIDSLNYIYDYEVIRLHNFCDSIKSYEGLSSNVYTYNGNRYIGYGHLLHTNQFSIGIDSITAIRLLYIDIFKAYSWGNIVTGLEGNKLLCITDFIYQYGIGTFVNSGLCIQILNNANDSIIKKELFKYIRYNGKVHKGFIKRRTFEYNLWLDTKDVHIQKN